MKLKNVGRGELEVLRFVIDHGPANVSSIAAEFARTKGHLRPTVVVILERLRAKGYLSRKKIEGILHYRPSIPEASLTPALVKNFVDGFLDGSTAPLVAFLQARKLSPSDSTDLRKALA